MPEEATSAPALAEPGLEPGQLSFVLLNLGDGELTAVPTARWSIANPNGEERYCEM